MFAKTQVADAINVATTKVASVPKASKKPSKATPSEAQMLGFCVAAFADAIAADATLQNAKALWDAARKGLRIELDRAHKVIGTGKAWDAFLSKLRAALVAGKVCVGIKEAGQLIRNQLKAVSLVGKGAKKGGRPEKTETGAVEKLSDKDVAARLVRILAFVAEWQQEANDDDTIGRLGTLAKLANGATE